MRALLVEVPDDDRFGPSPTMGTDLESRGARRAPTAGATAASGRLAERPVRPEEHDEAEGEPW
jgi:hypothetical protein